MFGLQALAPGIHFCVNAIGLLPNHGTSFDSLQLDVLTYLSLYFVERMARSVAIVPAGMFLLDGLLKQTILQKHLLRIRRLI